MILYEMFEQELPPEPTLIDALRDFLPIAVGHLNLDHIPKIKLAKEIHDTHVPTFGRFENESKIITVVIDNRNIVDTLRTLAHEMVHYAQGEEHRLDADSGETGSPIEDEANAEGGVIMRLFNQAHPNYMLADPIVLPEAWSEKYKKSINCNNPKGFSQKAHCAGRKKKANESKHCNVKNAVPELKAALEKRKTELKNASAKTAYDKIDKIMTRIAQTYNITGQQLHDMWTKRYGEIPDTWVLDENFADGKKPGRKGLAKRSGVDCKQSISKLRSIAKNSTGERQRMAHWCANMKSGRA